MEQPIAFYCRGRPQGADAFEIFQTAGRVFIGYPLLKHGRPYNPKALKYCLVDYMCPEDEWRREISGRRDTRSYSKNRNFIRRVTPGSIVVVPRPKQGAIYAGYITAGFETVDSPSWAEAYLELRQRQKLDTNDAELLHIADVALGWPVDKFRRISLGQVPGWIRLSMFGRSTYGEFGLHPLDSTVTAYSILDGFMMHVMQRTPVSWTLDPEQVKRRLVESLSPASFEHLMVALLQLEFPTEMWVQTGGSGDGGIDGIGSSENGTVVGLLQAKYYAAQAPALGDLGGDDQKVRRYVAILLPGRPTPPNDGTELLNLDWIVDAMIRHWRFLPQALSLRVGFSGFRDEVSGLGASA